MRGESRPWDWPAQARERLSPDTIALLLLALAVLLANAPALLGIFHLDPFDNRGGLTQAMTPGLLAGKPTIDPSNGFDSQAIGHLATFDLFHLHFPWWNPYEGTGMALLGETQSAALFPPTLLTALGNGQLYEHVLLELVAGICTYRVLRRLGLVRLASLAGAVAFALNGKFAWFTDAGVNPLAFLPMLILGVEHAFDAAREGRRGGWRLIALAGALTAYAGFPEVAYVDVLLAVVWAGWRAGCLPGSDRGRYLVRIGMGAMVSLLLAAPMLLAMVDYLSHADLSSHSGAQLGTRYLPARALPQLLMPYIFGPVNDIHHSGIWVFVGGYLSSTLLLFAGLGLISPGRRGLKLVLVGWDLLVFAHMYGLPPVLDQVLRFLPEMSRIQFYRYATAAFELPVIILAALGLDGLTRVTDYRRRVLAAAVVTLAAVIAVALLARPILHAMHDQPPHANAFLSASLVWGMLTAAAAGGFTFVRRARLRSALLALVVIVDAVALFAVPQFSAPRATKVDLAPVAYLHRHLSEQRFFTLGPLQANYGSYFRLSEVRVDDFAPKNYVHFLHSRLDPYARFVGFQRHHVPTERTELLRHLGGYRDAGVRYILTVRRHPLPSMHGALRLVFLSPTTRIYRLSRAAPFFSAPGCRVSSTQLDAVRLVCRHATTLTRRETWFDGWSARVDGRPVRIHGVDGVFQAVHIPAGTHRVSFHFTPVDMDWALLALLLGAALMLAPLARRAPAATPIGDL